MRYALLGLVHVLLVLIAAVEILTSRKDVLAKLAWLLVVLLLPVVGLVAYFLLGRELRTPP
jgi:hypothetical protein